MRPRLAAAAAWPSAAAPAAAATTVPPPGRADVDVDTAELRDLKDEAGIEDCQDGPGDGGLPDVTLPCLGGGTDVDLSTLRGPMVVNLWAIWLRAVPQGDADATRQFHEKYGDQVAVLGIDYQDTQPGAALALAQETGVTYPLLADPDGELLEQTELRLAKAPAVPAVDADGRGRPPAVRRDRVASTSSSDLVERAPRGRRL